MDPSHGVRLSVNWEVAFFSRARHLLPFQALVWFLFFFLTYPGTPCGPANRLSHCKWEERPAWEAGWSENYLLCWWFWGCPCFFRSSHFQSFKDFGIPICTLHRQGRPVSRLQSSRYRWWILVEHSLARNKVQVKETMEGGVCVSIKKKKKSRKASVDEQWVSPL